MYYRSYITATDTNDISKCQPKNCGSDSVLVNLSPPNFNLGPPRCECIKKDEVTDPKGRFEQVYEETKNTNLRGGEHKSADCSGDCGWNPFCYWHKMVNNCGGSTGFCDVAALPGCESWYKYLPLIAIGTVGLILFLLLKRR